MNMGEKWDALFREIGVIRSGHFKLSSGLHTDTYIDKDALTARPMILWELCHELMMHFSTDQIDVVVGPESGGAKVAFALGWSMDERYADKTIETAYAEKSDEGGYIFKRGHAKRLRGKRALIVDDVLTTGETLRKVIEAVEENGGIPHSILVIWDRSEAGGSDLGFHVTSFRKETFPLWDASVCPLCKRGDPINDEFV